MDVKFKAYFDLAEYIAKHYSKDTSTQVAAILLSEDSEVELSRGYNGIPRGCNDLVASRHQRPEKYEWFEHAERNAIFNYIGTYFKESIAIITYPLSMSCARALVQSGIVLVWGSESNFTPKVLEMFNEAGVLVPCTLTEQGAVFSRTGIPYSVLRSRLDRYLDEAYFRAKDSEGEACIILDYSSWAVLSTGVRKVLGSSGTGTADPYFEHAVRVAIFDKARMSGLKGCQAVVTFMPCFECARALVQVGCTHVITAEPDLTHPRWGEHFKKSLSFFENSAIKLSYI